MNLPSPDNYSTWQEWARALVQALADAGITLDLAASDKSQSTVQQP